MWGRTSTSEKDVIGQYKQIENTTEAIFKISESYESNENEMSQISRDKEREQF